MSQLSDDISSPVDSRLGSPLGDSSASEYIPQMTDAVRKYRLDVKRGKNRHYVIHEVGEVSLSGEQDPSLRTEIWKTKSTPLGQGGQGKVFLQTCQAGGRRGHQRVVKVIPVDKNDTKRRYWKEIDILIRFSAEQHNDHFVKILGWYDWGSCICIAMKYLPEGDLQSYLDSNDPLSENEAQQVTCQILQGLSSMHTSKIAHRDIKPANILIEQRPAHRNTWWVKIGDFGLSKNIDSTVTYSMPGTRAYMAPELFQTDHEPSKADRRPADMWSLGCTVFYVMTKSRNYIDMRSPSYDEKDVGSMIPSGIVISGLGIGFLAGSIEKDVKKRFNCHEATQHPWITQNMLEMQEDVFADDDDSSIPSSLSSTRHSFSEEAASTLATSRQPRFTTTAETSDPVDKPRDQETPLLRQDEGSAQVQARKRSDFVLSWHSAVDEGKINIIQWFLDHDVDLESLNNAGHTALIIAVKNGDLEVVKLLLDRGAQPNTASTGKDGLFPLHFAAREGYLEIARTLVEHGAALVHVDGRGWHSQHFAAAGGHVAFLRYLADLGCTFEVIDIQFKCTPIELAANNGHTEAVRWLLDRGVDVNNPAGSIEGSAMWLAVRGGYKDIVELFINHGTVHQDMYSLFTLMHCATSSGHPNVRKLLDDWQTPPKQRGTFCSSPYVPFPRKLTCSLGITTFLATGFKMYFGDEVNSKLYAIRSDIGIDNSLVIKVHAGPSPQDPLLAMCKSWNTTIDPMLRHFFVPSPAMTNSTRPMNCEVLGQKLKLDLSPDMESLHYHFSMASGIRQGDQSGESGDFEWLKILSPGNNDKAFPQIFQLRRRGGDSAANSSQESNSQTQANDDDDGLLAVLIVKKKWKIKIDVELRFSPGLENRALLTVIITAICIVTDVGFGRTNRQYVRSQLGYKNEG